MDRSRRSGTGNKSDVNGDALAAIDAVMSRRASVSPASLLDSSSCKVRSPPSIKQDHIRIPALQALATDQSQAVAVQPQDLQKVAAQPLCNHLQAVAVQLPFNQVVANPPNKRKQITKVSHAENAAIDVVDG